MEYRKIIAIAGLPGLHELVVSKSDGAIVKSLEDKSTKFVSSRVHHFTQMDSIEIYTTRGNVNLTEVFHAMQKSREAFPDVKDNGALKKYFEKVYPDMDFERVYASDMKKMIKWLEQLAANNVEIKLEEAAAEETAPEVVEEAAAEEVVPEVVEAAAPKKTAPKKKEKTVDTAEKAPKKAARKKKAEE